MHMKNIRGCECEASAIGFLTLAGFMIFKDMLFEHGFILMSIDINRHRCCTALTFGPPATPG